MPKQIFVKPEEIRRVIPLAGGRQLELTRPLIMGVLNVTPDSFSDGGQFDSPESAVEHALRMVADGADIIDIGGESSRPGADPVNPEVELNRVIPVIEAVREKSDIPISIDSYRRSTVARAVSAGADIVNDISALRSDPALGEFAAENKLPVVLMHMQGTPRDMQQNPHYTHCVEEIAGFFAERIDYATRIGIDKSKLILDPGIGFGKRLNDNLDILSHLSEFKRFGLPLLIGASRKSFIGMLHSGEAEDRIGGSIAAAVMAVMQGANIVRVHDVAATVEALKVAQAVLGAM